MSSVPPVHAHIHTVSQHKNHWIKYTVCEWERLWERHSNIKIMGYTARISVKLYAPEVPPHNKHQHIVGIHVAKIGSDWDQKHLTNQFSLAVSTVTSVMSQSQSHACSCARTLGRSLVFVWKCKPNTLRDLWYCTFISALTEICMQQRSLRACPMPIHAHIYMYLCKFCARF